MRACPVADESVLGPDSLTWRYFGSWIGLLAGPWLGTMQNMHPAIGGAVRDHSTFFCERWQRLLRSTYPINGVVFDGARGAVTGREIRDYHRTIAGVDETGEPYHALDPEAFYWAHATFAMNAVRLTEWLDGPLSEAQRARLYDEHVDWYARYGVSMRPVPESAPAFDAYWDRMCRERLRVTPEARAVLELSELPPPPLLARIPRVVWRPVWRRVARIQLWIASGFFDPEIRDMLGLAWNRRDERRFRSLGRVLGRLHRLIPVRFTAHPRAFAGMQMAAGRRPGDSPLVHTSPRNLPPLGHRDDRHYLPPYAR